MSNDLTGTVITLSEEDVAFLEAAFEEHRDLSYGIAQLIKKQYNAHKAAWDRVRGKWPEYSEYDLYANRAKKQLIILGLADKQD